MDPSNDRPQTIAPLASDEAGAERKNRRIYAEVKIVDPPKKSRFHDFVGHPLFVTAIGFALTGILGTYFTTYLNTWAHERDRQTSLRENAVAAIEDISELVNERRVRASMVVSAIKRGAPEPEASARKAAYDESFVRWNAKMPGDVLRMRVGLAGAQGGEGSHNEWGRTHYEKYIDALINADIFKDLKGKSDGPPSSESPGLFAIMDNCLTKAMDLYRENTFIDNGPSLKVLKSCRFDDVKTQALYCFARIAESIYRAVNEIGNTRDNEPDEAVMAVCQAPAPAP